MWELIQWLFIGHAHKWVTVREQAILNDSNHDLGISYYCRCMYCGKPKVFNCL